MSEMFGRFLRQIGGWVGCAGMIGLLFSTTVLATVQPTAPLEKVSLQLKWLHQFQFAGYYAAQKQGYYRDAGLQVDIRQRDPLKNNIQQVIDGEADYGVADSILLVYLARKAPVVIVAPIFQHSPQVIFTLASSGLDSPYKLNDKKIAFYQKDTDGFPILAMMQQLGVHPIYDRARLKTDPNMLIRKEVDGYVGYLANEAYSLREQGAKINVINPMNYGIDLYGDMLFTSQKEAQNHPDRVLRFKKATLRGWRYAMAHKAEMARYILKTYHPHKTFEHLMYEAKVIEEAMMLDTIPIGTLDEGRLQFIAHLLKQHGLTSNGVDLNKGVYRPTVEALQFSSEEKRWMNEHPVIKLAIDQNWNPIQFVDEKGEYKGIAAGFFRYISHKTGLVFQPAKNLTWSQAVEKMKHRQLDVFAAAIETSSRKQYVDFTQSYLNFPMVIATREGTPYIADMKQLSGKTIAVVEDYTAHEKLKLMYPNIHLKLVKTPQDGLTEVAMGEADGYIDNVAVIGHYIRNEGLTNLKISGEMPFRADVAIGVRKDWPELHSILQKVLLNMPQETYASLVNPWLQVSYQKQYDWKELFMYIGPVSIALLMVLFFYFKLRKAQGLLQETNAKLSVLSITDHLTGVYNRQYLDQTLQAEKERAHRYDSTFSVIMMDLDDFKEINDTYGHLLGDEVLIQVTQTIQVMIRKTDTLGRWGGEEFMVICPETDSAHAVLLAEKIRKAIESQTYPKQIHQTVSLGVAQYYTLESIHECVNEADQNLYLAKKAGKNRVSSGEPT